MNAVVFSSQVNSKISFIGEFLHIYSGRKEERITAFQDGKGNDRFVFYISSVSISVLKL